MFKLVAHLQHVTSKCYTCYLISGFLLGFLSPQPYLAYHLVVVSAATVLTLVVRVALNAGITAWRRVLFAAGDNIEVSLDRLYREVVVNEPFIAVIVAVALSCRQFYRNYM